MELKHGIASPSTITRMLCGIDEELALYAFMEWIGEIVDSKNTHLAIDGKGLRGATEKTKGAATPMLLECGGNGPGIDTCTASGRCKDRMRLR